MKFFFVAKEEEVPGFWVEFEMSFWTVVVIEGVEKSEQEPSKVAFKILSWTVFTVEGDTELFNNDGEGKVKVNVEDEVEDKDEDEGKGEDERDELKFNNFL